MIIRSNLSQPVYKETIETVRISSATRHVACLGLRGCGNGNLAPNGTWENVTTELLFFSGCTKVSGAYRAHSLLWRNGARESASREPTKRLGASQQRDPQLPCMLKLLIFIITLLYSKSFYRKCWV